jgi:regulator of protease activity HflC (stomatin/prohibitin superfamily)
MAAIVWASILAVVALIFIIVYAVGVKRSKSDDDYGAVGFKLTGAIGAASAALGVALIFIFGSFYTQDPGQASVLRSWTGSIVGTETESGLHTKAPWVDVVTFDIRNQRVVYVSEQTAGAGDNTGGLPDGPQITVQDKEGVTANLDIAIRYSISPDAVTDIYKQYLNEENLKAKLIFNDVRSVVRSIPGQFTTLEMLTERDTVQNLIKEALEERWADDGLIVDDVALQEIRYPETVTGAFAEAQAAQVQVTTEQAKLEATKVSAQQKVVQAQAEADANELLAQSLTPQILQQRYIDKLGEGTIYIVPDGSTPFIGTK